MFWTALGLGAGVAAAVMVSRWMRRQRERYSPATIAGNAAEGWRDLRDLFRTSVEEGRRAMAEKEAEIRSSLPQ